MTSARNRLLPHLLLVLALGIGPAAGAGELPWRQAGLSEREAAAHLLDRFTYGARPGDVDRVVEIGIEVWLERQLSGGLRDPEVDRRLADFHSLTLSARAASATYPPPFLVLREAERAGIVSREEIARAQDGEDEGRGLDGPRREVVEWARSRGYRPARELVGELMAQKLVRAVYSENQLPQVLADFWFNHFNVSITDTESRVYVSAYERDAIRPFVLGSFPSMLEATAKHPAMLHYLDNARSVADEGSPTTLDGMRRALERRGRGGRGRGFAGGGTGRGRAPGGLRGDPELQRLIDERRPRGLNENYARELLELHTLGVDGGYDQDDVITVARAFTGWTTYPPGSLRDEVEERIARARRLPKSAGFVFEGSFLFRADAHDAGKKTVLGRTYPAGRGIEDGLEVLAALAGHPRTAHHLAAKLAVRFVSDEPPPALVERLAGRFLATGGDLREVMRTLAAAPEFWSPQARRAKIKSPFGLAASALRGLDADVEEPRAVLEWVARMGQPLYAYQAPTGYPEVADAWVNTGALLHRMNFGLQLATGRVPGVRFDLAAINGGREPESLAGALTAYVPLLLPERDPSETVRRLEPVIHDPDLARKIAEAAPQDGGWDPAWDDWDFDGGGAFGERGRSAFDRWREAEVRARYEVDDSPLAHVVGVILGSPEFQRR